MGKPRGGPCLVRIEQIPPAGLIDEPCWPKRSTGGGRRFTSPYRRTMLSIIRSWISPPPIPPVVVTQEIASRSQQSRVKAMRTILTADLEPVRATSDSTMKSSLVSPELPTMAPPAQPSWTGGLGPAAVTISLLLSLILVLSSVSLSESIGRLTQPPGYDDIFYMLESYNLYQLLLQSGPFGVMQELSHAHAPLQDVLGIAGYWLFGVADRSVYLVNGVLAVAFTSVLLWLTRTLRPLVRIVL